MNSRRLRILILTTLAAFVLMLPTVASAQLQDICTPVRYIDSGETVEREIDDENYIWAFCFDAEAGDTVTIDLEVVSGDLIAFVSILEQSSEQVVAARDDITPKSTDNTLEYEVENAGTYIIAVGRDGGETGPTGGIYAISFTQETTSAPPVASGDCPSGSIAIEPGDQMTGTITDDNYFVAYCFSANEGDVVAFEANATSGNLDTLLMLTDADLSVNYAENDDIESGNTDSALEYEIEASGSYVIAVGRYNTENGSSTGDFVLSFDLEPGEGGLVKDPAGSGGDIACDEDPLDIMIAGLWEISSDDLVMTFDFECGGDVTIQVNKNDPFTATYTIEPDETEVTYTLVIDLGGGDELRMESAVIAESGILALLQGDTPDDESLIFMSNLLYEENE